jgi:glycosyltransferase involved in cell wall biosynthesis
MGWKIESMADFYGMKDYLIPATMGNIDKGGGVTEDALVDIYNMMDVFALPTAGEGFGIPTIEAMSCGKPVVITNYTTGFELVGADDPYKDEIPLFPHGDGPQNGRDYLEDGDWTNRGCLVPYKDMWWDTPQRAAPQRAIVSEVAMGQAFSKYYHDRDLLFKHGKNARNHSKKFYDWSVIATRWKDFIKRVEKGMKK